MYLGETCLTLATLHILAAFDVRPARPAAARAAEVEYAGGIVRCVASFLRVARRADR